MKASNLLFRLRLPIFIAIYAIGFTAPWNLIHRIDTKRDSWSWLMVVTSSHTPVNFQTAAILYLAAGTLCALLAALTRTWASAYMGSATVHDRAMHGAHIVAAGPYRFTRNPLYIGVFLQTLAIALLMPPTGAVFAIIATTTFLLILISSEELFLTHQLGQIYLDYKSRVSSILPALTPRIPSSGTAPAWGNAVLSEIYYWGLFLTFAIFGRQYNALPLMRGVLISLGISLIIRALLPKQQSPP